MTDTRTLRRLTALVLLPALLLVDAAAAAGDLERAVSHYRQGWELACRAS